MSLVVPTSLLEEFVSRLKGEKRGHEALSLLLVPIQKYEHAASSYKAQYKEQMYKGAQNPAHVHISAG